MTVLGCIYAPLTTIGPHALIVVWKKNFVIFANIHVAITIFAEPANVEHFPQVFCSKNPKCVTHIRGSPHLTVLGSIYTPLTTIGPHALIVCQIKKLCHSPNIRAAKAFWMVTTEFHFSNTSFQGGILVSLFILSPYKQSFMKMEEIVFHGWTRSTA